jgi:hypothetical protein
VREARGGGAGILPDDEPHPSRGDARTGGLVEPGRGAEALSLYAEFVKKSPNSVIPAKAGIQKEHITPQPSHWIPAFAGMTQGTHYAATLALDSRLRGNDARDTLRRNPRTGFAPSRE